MAIRIYTLAKQLRVENKLVLDACKTLGIAGKGSALASLSDEQVASIKEHLTGGAKKPKVAAGLPPQDAAGPAPMAPPAKQEAAGKVPALPTAPADVPSQAPPEPEEETTPSVATPLPTSHGPPQVTPTRPSGSVRREDYIGPAGTVAGKMPQMDSKPDKPDGPDKSGPSRPDEGSGPTIKLVPLPNAALPKRAKKSKEPAPQKPDIRLPPDAIRASKASGKPPVEHLAKHDKKRKAKKPGDVRAGADESAAGGNEKSGTRPAGFGNTLGGREARQLRRKRTTSQNRRRRDDDDGTSRRVSRRLRRTGHASTAAPRKHNVVLELPCTVKSFAEALGLPVAGVQKTLLGMGMMLTVNAFLDFETAELLATEYEVQVDFRQQVSLEEKLIAEFESQEDSAETLQPRAPVVTFLGHVDHGKTSLLDRIIGIDVVAGEKGGITQHIRAYQIEKGGRPIAFVDTPGHEAFTEMRARGANCTDIAVLVVAADDGVMPQTVEAISHARAAEVPVVVALNKIDLPGANPDRALQELAANELLPSEWGGDIEVVRTSAMTGEGIDELLETLLTIAELHEYQANPDRPAMGVCLEAEIQQGRGVVAKMLVEQGTLRVGDVVVCGPAHGRVKAMYDTLNPRQRHKQAGPAMPVNLTGLDVVPGAGDRFHILSDISQAREIAQQRAVASRERELAGTPTEHITLENLHERLDHQGEVQILNVILRADVRGSIEAIRKELSKLEHPEVQIKILQQLVGGITEADVTLADASDAIIIGFSVVPDEGARVLADQRGVQIRQYDIIYQVTEDVKAALEGMLKPEKREADLGRALVQRTFTISRMGTIAGCRVLSGHIRRDSRVRVIRESRVIGDYPLESLRREKDDAREVREGLECGIKLGGFNDLKEGDILEAYKIEEVARTF